MWMLEAVLQYSGSWSMTRASPLLLLLYGPPCAAPAHCLLCTVCIANTAHCTQNSTGQLGTAVQRAITNHTQAAGHFLQLGIKIKLLTGGARGTSIQLAQL